MEWLIWIGTAVALIGVLLLIYCIAAAVSAKRAGLQEDELRGKLQRVLILNMGALFISAIGLMCVILGVFLG